MGISIRLSGINHFVYIAKPHAGNAIRWKDYCMNKSFIGQYVDKKGRLVIYSRADGGGSVAIEKEDAGEVILWLASFQQGVQPTVATVAPPEVESTKRNSG